MKKLIIFTAFFALLFIVNCNAQPKTDYEIYSEAVTGASKYHFFLEKKSANPYQLTQNMDYLAPDITSLKVGEAAVPTFTVNLINDGSEYRVGIVVENTLGFYSGMGVATGDVGTVPTTPAGVGFRKK